MGKVQIAEQGKQFQASSEAKEKLALRRGTMMPSKKGKKVQITTPTTYKRLFRWWQKPSVKYAFSHPYVRSRLEKLMGSNLISLTDRTYMQQLQERILENYANDMNKRIAAREANERERVKNLVLTGMIPLDDAPPEMIDHPVRLIEMYCRKLIAERREKIKIHKGFIPKRLYPDDTPDPPSGLAIEEGHMFRKREERLCHPPQCVLGVSDKDDIKRGYMFTDEQYAELKLEGSLIQQLREAQTVEEMYSLADTILSSPAEL